MLWNLASLLVALLASGWAIRLYRSGEPTWRLALCVAIPAFVSASLGITPWRLGAIFAIIAFGLVFYLMWRFDRITHRDRRAHLGERPDV